MEYVDSNLKHDRIMEWNYRILAHREDTEIYFEIHEVYYDANGKPEGYAEGGINVSGENIKAILLELDSIRACSNLPVLWGGDRFPEEYS